MIVIVLVLVCVCIVLYCIVLYCDVLCVLSFVVKEMKRSESVRVDEKGRRKETNMMEFEQHLIEHRRN